MPAPRFNLLGMSQETGTPPQAQEAPAKPKRRRQDPPHKALLILPGRFGEGAFHSPRLPEGVQVLLGEQVLADPAGVEGEGFFYLWPRTSRKARLKELHLGGRLRQGDPEAEVVVQGLLLQAGEDLLALRIVPRTPSAKPFLLRLHRGRGFTAPLRPGWHYRMEGRLVGSWLVVDRAWPLREYLRARARGEALPPAIAGGENPYLAPPEGGGS